MNSEIMLNPRAYEGAVFDMIYGTANFVFCKTQSMVDSQ